MRTFRNVTQNDEVNVLIGTIDISSEERMVICVTVKGEHINCCVPKIWEGYSYKDLKRDLVDHFGTTSLYY